MSYRPVQTILRHVFVGAQSKVKLVQAGFWSAAYLFVGVCFLIPLLADGHMLLVALGIAGATAFLATFAVSRRRARTIPGDLMSVCGLTLTAPAEYYVGSGVLDMNAAMLWVFSILFFGSSVLYVHMKMRATQTGHTGMKLAERLSLGKLNFLYHFAVIALVTGMGVYQHAPYFALGAFVPMILHAMYGTFRLSGSVLFKQLGFLLLGQSVLFGVLLSGAMQW